MKELENEKPNEWIVMNRVRRENLAIENNGEMQYRNVLTRNKRKFVERMKESIEFKSCIAI